MIVIGVSLIFLMIFRLSVYTEEIETAMLIYAVQITQFCATFQPSLGEEGGNAGLRMEPTAHAKTVLTMDSRERNEMGDSRTRWRRTILEEIKRLPGICWGRTTGLVQDWAIWRNLIEAPCATMDLRHSKI